MKKNKQEKVDKKEYQQKYREKNKEILAKKRKDNYSTYYKKNKDKICLNNKRYRQNHLIEIREKDKLRSEKRRNEETRINWLKEYNTREDVKQKMKLHRRKYKHSNRGKLARAMDNWQKATRNKKLIIPMLITIDDLERIQEQYPSCVYCNSKEKLTFDHIIAISKQGKHIKENIVTCCLQCNSSKGQRNLMNWFTQPYCKRKNINLQTIHQYAKQYYLDNLNKRYSEMKL
jgi:5-methylcytosine-specific restriction endonuclease McrA